MIADLNRHLLPNPGGHPAVEVNEPVPEPDGEPSEALAKELQEHVKAQTAPYKYPRIVEFADQLPKTRSGKIKRAELRGAP